MKQLPEENMEKIRFINKEHERFFYKNMMQIHDRNPYNASLIYLLGISEITRENFDQIFDLKKGLIKPGCFDQGWQTSSTIRTIRLAFNLYTDQIPHDDDSKYYSVSNVFCSSYAPFYWQSVKLRYPEYCQ